MTTRELVCNKVKSPDMNISRLFQMAFLQGAPSMPEIPGLHIILVMLWIIQGMTYIGYALKQEKEHNTQLMYVWKR
jgi:hypothetical protein